jgi:hypothetical protein
MFGSDIGMDAAEAQPPGYNAGYLRQCRQVAKESLLGSLMGVTTHTFVTLK